MTRREKILTAALFRCACTLAHYMAMHSPPDGALSLRERYDSETAVAIAAMNLSLDDARRETKVWLRRMERGYEAYRRLGGPDLSNFEGGIES